MAAYPGPHEMGQIINGSCTSSCMLIYVHDILQLLHFLGVRGVRTATLQPRIKFSIETTKRTFSLVNLWIPNFLVILTLCLKGVACEAPDQTYYEVGSVTNPITSETKKHVLQVFLALPRNLGKKNFQCNLLPLMHLIRSDGFFNSTGYLL